MPEELKPCPYCGNDYPAKCFDPSLGWKYSIICNVCGMQGPRTKASDEAHAAWNALPRSSRITPNDADCAGCPERRDQGLVWTKEPPTVPGWYWLYEESSPSRPVEVVPFGPKGIMHIHGYTEMQPVASIMGWWAGPLLRPEEPVS